MRFEDDLLAELDLPKLLTPAQRRDLVHEAMRIRDEFVVPARKQRDDLTRNSDQLRQSLITKTKALDALRGGAVVAVVGSAATSEGQHKAPLDGVANGPAATKDIAAAHPHPTNTEQAPPHAEGKRPHGSCTSPPQPTTGGPRPNRQLSRTSAVFGMLKGTLATAMKERATAAPVVARRLELEKDAQRAVLEEEVTGLQRDLANLTPELHRVSEDLARFEAQLKACEEVVVPMAAMERQFELSHHLCVVVVAPGGGGGHGGGHPIYFAPAVHTDASARRLRAQLTTALESYLPFRQKANQLLIEIDGQRTQRRIRVKRDMMASAGEGPGGNSRGGISSSPSSGSPYSSRTLPHRHAGGPLSRQRFTNGPEGSNHPAARQLGHKASRPYSSQHPVLLHDLAPRVTSAPHNSFLANDASRRSWDAQRLVGGTVGLSIPLPPGFSHPALTEQGGFAPRQSLAPPPLPPGFVMRAERHHDGSATWHEHDAKFGAYGGAEEAPEHIGGHDHAAYEDDSWQRHEDVAVAGSSWQGGPDHRAYEDDDAYDGVRRRGGADPMVAPQGDDGVEDEQQDWGGQLRLEEGDHPSAATAGVNVTTGGGESTDEEWQQHWAE